MSNAMRLGKRTLAGVAAGALVAGVLVTVGSIPAQAATVTAEGPIVAAAVNDNISTDDSNVAAIRLTTPAPGQQYATDDTTVLQLISAPGVTLPTATSIRLINGGAVDDSNAVSIADTQLTDGIGAADWTVGAAVITAPDGRPVTTAQGGTPKADAVASGFVYVTGKAAVPTTTALNVAFVAASGTMLDGWELYLGNAGTYVFQSGAAATTWSVTTTGTGTSIRFNPNTRTVAAVTGAAVTYDAQIRDANGNLTQLVGGQAIAVPDPNANLTLSDNALSVTDMQDGEFEITATVGGAPPAAGPYTITATGNVFLGGITGTATLTVVAVAETTDMSVVRPASAFDADTGDGQADFPIVWQIKPGTTVVEVESTLDPAATSNEVSYTVYYDDTTAADIIGTGLAVAEAGKTKFSITVAPAQAVAGTELYFFDGTLWLEAAFTAENQVFVVTPAAQVRATATGGSTAWTVTAGTQYGDPLAGWTATLTTTATSRNASADIEATTGATGQATLTLPDASTSTTNLDDSVTIEVALNDVPAINISTDSTGENTAAFGVAVRYSATGAVTMTDLRFANVPPASFAPRTPSVPYAGVVGAFNQALGSTRDDTRLVQITAIASLPGSTVTFSGSEGVGFLPTGVAQSIADGENSLQVVSDPNTGLATAFYYSTKTNANTVTVTSSSGSELSGTINNLSNANAARNFEIIAPAEVTLGSLSTITVRITDGFGNLVNAFGTGTGFISMQTSLGILGGAGSTFNVLNANTLGEATVSLISTSPGTATIEAQGFGGQFGDAKDEPIPGFAVSVDTGGAEVKFVEGPTAKSIAIAGSRTEVKGKPGILIDGLTTGIENGKTVIPYFRFPGSTEYTQGSARPVVNDDEFTWQRKTGKKFYAYVTNDDGAVKSNRVIIPAQ